MYKWQDILEIRPNIEKGDFPHNLKIIFDIESIANAIKRREELDRPEFDIVVELPEGRLLGHRLIWSTHFNAERVNNGT